MMATVLVTARSFSTGSSYVERRLVDAGLLVARGPATHEFEALTPLLTETVAWVAGTGPVTAEHLDRAPGLRVVARYGVGVEAVDLDAARVRGIVVTNTPGANTDAVADHTVALLLAALRGVVAGDRRVRAGDWRVERTREVASLRVGLIGVGRIGRAVAQRLAGFAAVVFGVDPHLTDEELAALGIMPGGVAIPEGVDVVCLHAPGTAVIVNAEWIARARPGLILVNTARGSLVDEQAVAEGLRQGHLAGYATDTLAVEGGVATSPLLAPDIADRVVVTPHSAAQTVEAVDRMGSMAVDSVLDVLAGRVPRDVVEGSGSV
jgi:D-3-phosphoglycerate dehydrogenase